MARPDIGPFSTMTSVEIGYDRPNGPPIEVDIEISGIVYCDDPEWGIEARDVTAKILERDLSESEIEVLGLEQILAEAFHEAVPCTPKIGDYYRCNADGYLWKVADVCLPWESTLSTARMVLLERPGVPRLSLMDMREPLVVRRVIDLVEFAYGTTDEGKTLFEWTRNEPKSAGKLRAIGD